MLATWAEGSCGAGEGACEVNSKHSPQSLAHTRRIFSIIHECKPFGPRAPSTTPWSPVSLRLGHARALTPPCGVIHSPRDAALPPGGRLLPYRSSYRLDEALGDCAKHFARGGFPADMCLRHERSFGGSLYSTSRIKHCFALSTVSPGK